MHPNDGHVVSNFIVQALLGRDITIYGDGSQTRSFCYVDDLTDGLIRLMASRDSVTGPVNIGDPSEFTILEVATQIIAMIGSPSRIVHRRVRHSRRMSASTGRVGGADEFRCHLHGGTGPAPEDREDARCVSSSPRLIGSATRQSFRRGHRRLFREVQHVC
jgi:nucleoside-diphosphate-sugar epimerase